MTRMVKLGDGEVYVQPAHVIAVTPAGEGRCVIRTVDGKVVEVHKSAESVWRTINAEIDRSETSARPGGTARPW